MRLSRRTCQISILTALIASVLIPRFSGTVQVAAAQGVAASSGIYWGASLYGKPPDSVNFAPGGLFYNFENNITHKGMSIINWGAPWEYPTGTMLVFQRWYFDNVRNHGSIPMVSWGSWACCDSNEPKYKLSNITRGDFDGFIRQWATDAKNWGHPFFLRFDHEMNGTWQFPWSANLNGNNAADYVAAWRHVHDIFAQVGATNVTWVWCGNISDDRTTPLNQLYPGDAYVDWLALDGYNWYTRQAMPWLSFSQVFSGTPTQKQMRDSYTEITSLSPSKPLMIAEFATVELGDGGAAKAAWISSALTSEIPTHYPKIKAIVYFNWDAGAGIPWPIESSAASQNAFAAGIQSSIYIGNTLGNLGSTGKPPDTIGVYSNGVFYLRNSNTSGYADMTVAYGSAGMLPVTGDWNGDGVDTIGVYNTALGVFMLRDSNTSGPANYTFVLGNPGDTPVAGRWDSSMGHDGAGVFRPSNGLLYLRKTLTTGYADYTMVLGNPGDRGITGDWDGNGYDSIGVYRPSNGMFYLSNAMAGTTGTPAVVFSDYNFVFGSPSGRPFAGDFTGSGQSHVGMLINGVANMRTSQSSGPADITFGYGMPGALPVVGHWTAGSVASQAMAGDNPLNTILAPQLGAPVQPTKMAQPASPDGAGQLD